MYRLPLEAGSSSRFCLSSRDSKKERIKKKIYRTRGLAQAEISTLSLATIPLAAIVIRRRKSRGIRESRTKTPACLLNLGKSTPRNVSHKMLHRIMGHGLGPFFAF